MPPRSHAGFTPAQLEAIRTGLRTREARVDRDGLRGVDRIRIDVREGLSYRAHNPAEPDAAIDVGEPVSRGGTGEGSSPLSLFLAGAGSCLLNQLVRLSAADGLDLTFVRVTVRGEFRREPGGAFRRILCEAHADGTIEVAEAGMLVERAERLCYVHATLRPTVELTTVLVVSGAVVARSVSGPASGDPTS